MIDTITTRLEAMQLCLPHRAIAFLLHPRLWFALIVYPLLGLAYYTMNKWLVPLLLLYPLETGFVVYLCCTSLCIFTLLTLANRLFRRDLQGQKLRIRENQGMSVEHSNPS